jgi:hexosaminidase
MIGYPELASGPGPYSLESGDPIMDPTRESTYKFLDVFLAEMAKLFPDAYFHIGGDEVDGKQWDSNPKIQEFIHSHNMKNNQDLQAYFNQHLLKILTKNHKIMMGWDEILHPDLPKDIIVQSWRGQASLAAAAKEGYTGLLSNGYYLDLMWPASRHYAVDPMSGDAATLTPEQQKLILGGESCMWAEWITPENIDSHIWPRNAVIAERLWSPQNVTDVNSMYARLEGIDLHLSWLGLTQRSSRVEMLHRMAGDDDIASLHVLADVLEPVKDYHRSDGMPRPIDFHAPLNRMIDSINPESDVARDFSNLVQTYIQSGYKDQAAAMKIRHWLELWRNNDAKLRSLLQESFLLQEVAPLSQNLYSEAEAGLQALDALERGETTAEAWRTQQHAATAQAETAKAGLLLMVAAPIQQLVDASGNAAK